ncbi:hypothetical protein B0J12DRAFT_403789 [Macrophomina phaseolina]|uniref:Uncharacterized protein n=1 Tax=Macrophomina phaseolina TaxID=35725 RepID=A0ABQ8GLM9_9PEZI|nr:hypothetical protein B0J12DRAFT_403789 [Macrophomina phaseolina]
MLVVLPAHQSTDILSEAKVHYGCLLARHQVSSLCQRLLLPFRSLWLLKSRTPRPITLSPAPCLPIAEITAPSFSFPRGFCKPSCGIFGILYVGAGPAVFSFLHSTSGVLERAEKVEVESPLSAVSDHPERQKMGLDTRVYQGDPVLPCESAPDPGLRTSHHPTLGTRTAGAWSGVEPIQGVARSISTSGQ